MKKYIVMIASFLALAACEEDQKEVPDSQPVDEITVAPQTKTFSKDGGEQPVIVTSSGEWSLKVEETYDWIRPNIEKGQDGDEVVFTADPNYTGSKQTAKYTFICGKAETEFTAVSQSGDPCVLELASPVSLELKYEETDIEVEVNTNVNIKNLTENIVSSVENWCTYKTSIETEAGAKLVFALTRNDGQDSRSAEIEIGIDKENEPGSDNVTPIKVTVTQRAKPFIVPDKNLYELLPEGGTVEVSVDANVEYDVKVKDGWLKHGEKQNGKEMFLAEAYEGTRETVVTFTEKNPLEGEDAVFVEIFVKQAKASLVSKAIDMNGTRMWMSKGLGHLEDFTIEMLVKPEEFKSISYLFGWDSHLVLRFGGTSIKKEQMNLYGSQCTATEDGKGGYKYCETDSDVAYISDAECVISDNEWHHIALTVDTDGQNKFGAAYFAQMYIDGKLVHTGRLNKHSRLNVGEDFFGKKFYFGSETLAKCLNGNMAEIRVWQKVLSVDELNAENHFYTVDTNAEGLLAYWKFDIVKNDGSGYEVEDLTGKGCNLWVEKHNGSDFDGNTAPSLVDVALP